MLRRFEMYRLRSDVSRRAGAELKNALTDCSRFIPEMLDSAVGWNRTASTPVNLVWEHAYESTEAYARYMRHPYHICILDRYLLPDSPERVIVNDEHGIGLLGYEIDAPIYRRKTGMRRVVAFQLLESAAAEEVEELIDAMRETPGLALSIVAENTMGQEWFPGYWSHIWEQAFQDETSLRRYLSGSSHLANAERSGWRGEPVERSLAVEYWPESRKRQASSYKR